jgi:uncharacterized protein (TIGR03435 family)
LGQPVEGAPAFDVASVKAIDSGGGEGRGRETITPSLSGVTMKNVHLKSVVGWAYRLQAIQIVGPGWLDNDTYDIVAKASTEVPAERLRLMMQTLLANRFELEFHPDTKEMPAYVVSVAKGGHKLKESETTGPMELKPNGNGGAAFSRVTLTQLTEMTSSLLQGVVVDETGLKGSYDFNLDLSSFMGGDSRPNSLDEAIGILIRAANDQ